MLSIPAGVGGAGDGEGLVVHPAADLAVPVLPHRAHQVRTLGVVLTIGARGTSVCTKHLRLYLAVLDAAVHEAGPGVDQPVAAALRLVEEVE